MSETSDEHLLADYLAGRTECFERLVQRHQRELFHFLIRFTGSAAVAEDVVQEAFLQVHLSGDAFDPSRRFKPWLFTIAANKARDWLRGRSRRPEMALDAMIGGEDSGGQRFSDFLADGGAGPTRRSMTPTCRPRCKESFETCRRICARFWYSRTFTSFRIARLRTFWGCPSGR